MINGRRKGVRAELAFAAWLRGWYDPQGRPIQARRGQQFKGGGDSPDVVHTLTGVHFEVASRQNIDHGTEALISKCRQANADCAATDAIPIVAWRKRKRWWMTTFGVRPGSNGFWATAPAEEVMRALGCQQKAKP